jgi:hypothetical protein
MKTVKPQVGVKETERDFVTPPSTVTLKEISKEARKEVQGVDYFINELVGKELIITSVDLGNNIAEGFLGEDKVKVAWRSQVVTKKMAMIDKWIRSHNQSVKVRVIQKTSKKSGNTYIDLE